MPGTALFLNGDHIRQDDIMGEFDLDSGANIEAIDLDRGLVLSGETAMNARRPTSSHDRSRSRESREDAANARHRREEATISGVGAPRKRSRSRPEARTRR
eukprot:15681926-Heterocapsa_arctica.AAC.1